MDASEYHALDQLDPLDVMMEDKDILGLIDPEETAEMLQSLQDVLDKDIEMTTDSVDDVNNNNIIQASSSTCTLPDISAIPTSSSLEENQNDADKMATERESTSAGNTEETGTVSGDSSTSSSEDSDQTRNLRRSARQIEYNLRTSSILNRIETEQRRKMPKTPKPKNKPPPLSKYRRKTANSRERQRMQEINDAFVELQNVIPNLPANSSKLTKITTLRLALNYIASLREMLGYDDPLGPECTSPASSSSSPGSVVQSPRTSTDSDGMSVSTCSPGQRSGLDSEGESSYSS